MEYEVTKSKLKKKLIIQTNTSLPTPSQQVLNGTNPSLNLEVRFQASNDLDIVIDGEVWDKNTTKQTANKIEFKKEGTTIFSWSKPQYWDSDATKDKQISKYELKKSANNLFVSIIVPYSWLSDTARTYPLFIDPTFTDQGATFPVTIAKTEELANTGFETNLSSWNTYDNVLANLSPLAWWKMQEASGNIINSGSLSGIDGVATGSPNYRQTGPSAAIPYAIELESANSEWFKIPASASLRLTNAVTVLAWGKPNSTGAEYMGLVRHEYNGGASQAPWLAYGIGKNNLSPGAFTADCDADSTLRIVTDTANADTNWYYLAQTYDGTTMRLYKNAGEVGTAYSGGGNLVYNGATQVSIGNQYANNPIQYWDGRVAYVAIFNKVLTAAEISNLYMHGTDGVTRNTTITYSGSSGSARVIAPSGGIGNFTQSVNVSNTNTYTLEAYAYTNGNAVTSADAELYYNGATITTTYTSAGSGWYKLTGTLTGAAASRDYGVQVKAGKTVYVDNASLYFYASSETIESSTLDGTVTGAQWTTLAWTQTLPSGVGENSIRWRFGVKSADSSWVDSDFLGSDCTSSSFWTDTTSPFSVDLSSCSAFGTTGGRYGRYRLYFQTADRLVTPSVDTSTITYTILPIAPSGLSGAAGSSTDANGTTRLTWSWTDNASNESGFYVQDTSGNTVCTVSNPSTGSGLTATCTETALTPTTSYTRRVVAYNSAGNSTASSNASATTRTVAAPTLDSPGGGAYTTSERPAFRFQTPTDNTSTKKYSDVSTYTLKVNDKDGKEIFNIPSISSSRTTTDDRVRYKVSYSGFSNISITDNYITVETKSSGEWTTSQNNGKLKSGKNTWEVCSVDERSNTACNSRTLYLDDGSPTLTDVTISDSRTLDNKYYVTTTSPTVTGTAKDGTGLKELIILTEKANYFLGAITGYTAVHTTTLTLSGTSESVNHTLKRGINSANTGLELGTYRITLTLKDTASNEVSTNLTLSIVTLDTLRELFNLPREEITEKEAGQVDLSLESLAKTAKVRKQKEAEELKTTLAEFASILPTAQIKQLASTITSAMKDVAVALHLRGEEMRAHLEGGITVVAQFIARPIANTLSLAANTITTVYTNLKENAPDPVKIVLETQERVATAIVSTTTQLTNKFDERLKVASDKKPKQAGEDVRESFQQVALDGRKLVVIPLVGWDEVFNKEPPVITEVIVEEVGSNFAVVSWDTNHWSTGKVNYGEKKGQWSNNVFSSRRRKHHKVSISNLSGSTRYFFEIVSQNGGTTYDAYYYFDTK